MSADIQIQQLADKITANIKTYTKDVLTTDEAASYMGVSKSHLYRLTAQQKIPHYKPMGKMCYFKRTELVNWMLSNKIETLEELEQQAQTYCLKKGGQK